MVAARRPRRCIIGTRGSSLSACQTQLVQVALEERLPQCRFSVQTIKAGADRRPEVPLATLAGEGIFVKELESALLTGRIDLAVHSLKDLPLAGAPGLVIAAVPAREDASDALVSRPSIRLRLAQDDPEQALSLSKGRRGGAFEALPPGARVGTSSIRRRSQLLHLRRDLAYLDIRGNVDTRLRKLDEGQYDAVVVASCGLIRLGLEERISEYFSIEQMLPEPGQGALAIEARQDDRELLELLRVLDEPMTRACVEAERAFLEALGGGCRVPIAAFAQLQQDALVLDGAVIAPDGSKKLTERISGPSDDPEALGRALAERLLAQGAGDLLG